jgi:hypothetical protein
MSCLCITRCAPRILAAKLKLLRQFLRPRFESNQISQFFPTSLSVNGTSTRGPLRVAYPARVASGDNIDQAPACFPEFIGHSPRVSARRLHCDRMNFAMPIGRETDFAFRGMRRADGLLDVGRGRVVIGREARE